MPDVFSNIMFLNAFGLFEIFVGAWRLYIFARRPTNSQGGTDPVSLLNFKFTVVVCIILWKFSVEITRVVEIQTVHHVGIQIVSPDLTTQAVRIGEQKCTAICIFGLEVVVVKRVHDKF